jgi:atypical dual specificity phosphatase
MWTWTLNWGEITPQLVIGSCPMTPADLERIRDGTGAGALLSLQHDDCLAYWGIDETAMRRAGERLGLAMERRPIRDFDIADMRRNLPDAVKRLARLDPPRRRIYVHCTAGLGRAPLTVLGYLTLVEGLDPETAIRLILRGRPDAVPSWEAYKGARGDLVARHRDAIERRAYELFERLARGDAGADWHEAETEIIAGVLRGQRTTETLRIAVDPCASSR